MQKDMKHYIGYRIQKTRQSKKMTQLKLAELCNISVEAISNIERGINYPSFENLINIGAFLECPLSEIIDIPDEKLNRKRQDLEIQTISTIRCLSDTDLEIVSKMLNALK